MPGSSELQETDAGRFPLLSQQRLWREYDPISAFNPRFVIGRSLRIKGSVNTSALQEALNDVAARHEILRTVVVRDAEPPYQQVHLPSPVPLRVRALPDVADGSRDACARQLLMEAEQSRWTCGISRCCGLTCARSMTVTRCSPWSPTIRRPMPGPSI